MDGREIREEREEAHLNKEKRSETNKKQQQLEMEKVDGTLLTVIPDLLNGTTLSTEKFKDNLQILFGLQPQGLRPTCNV